MAYSFVAPLTTYTEQQRLPLITKAVFSARSASLFTKQVGIKSAAALNLMDFRIPDNTGAIISDKPVIPDAPAAYFTTLPIHSMLIALIKANIPAEISLSAGSYLCNQIFKK